jgi:hypothetical protein
VDPFEDDKYIALSSSSTTKVRILDQRSWHVVVKTDRLVETHRKRSHGVSEKLLEIYNTAGYSDINNIILYWDHVRNARC